MVTRGRNIASKKNKICVLLGVIIGLVISACIFVPFVGGFETNEQSMSSCGSPVASEQVKVINDRDAFAALHELLQSAQKSIHMSQFELKYYTSEKYKDSQPNQIVRDLIDAKKRGVEVKVVVDEYGNKDDAVTKVLIMLKKEGVEAKLDNPKTTTHTKLTIVDGKAVMVGSTNMSHFAFNKNHEANAVIYSESVAADFERYFDKIWAES